MADNPHDLPDSPREALEDDDYQEQAVHSVFAIFGYLVTFYVGYKALKRRMRSGKGGHDAALFGIAWLAARQSIHHWVLKREIREVADDE